MTKKIILALTIFAAVGAIASAQTAEEKAVRDVLTKEAAAVEKGDLAALDKIWANDESVTVFESGHANYGWTDYRDNHLTPELKEFKNTKYAFSDLKVKSEKAYGLREQLRLVEKPSSRQKKLRLKIRDIVSRKAKFQ